LRIAYRQRQSKRWLYETLLLVTGGVLLCLLYL